MISRKPEVRIESDMPDQSAAPDYRAEDLTQDIYGDASDSLPPPYPDCDEDMPITLLDRNNRSAERPPEYNFYDVERGSLMEIILSQYAQSITPRQSATRYSTLDGDDHDENCDEDEDENAADEENALVNCSRGGSRLRSCLFYCMAMFCGIVWAVFWICAIGYAIVISFDKLGHGIL